MYPSQAHPPALFNGGLNEVEGRPFMSAAEVSVETVPRRLPHQYALTQKLCNAKYKSLILIR